MSSFVSQPQGATLSDSAWRTPSEIPSRTRSVSAFLPGRVSMSPPAPPGKFAHGNMTPLETLACPSGGRRGKKTGC